MLKKALKIYFQNKSNLLFLVLVVVSSFSWILTMFKSGLNYKFGLGFWGANGHDGIWHIALANNLLKFSLENPVFAGESIKNYHIGFGILLALINKLTNLPMTFIYFQILPIIFTIFVGILIYRFVFLWTKSHRSAILSALFIYIGGSASWMLGKGESAFWSQQSISTLINPPYVLSLIFILFGLISLQKKNLLVSILFFGVLLQTKAYSAVLVLGGLFVSGVYSYFKLKESLYLKSFFGSLVLNLLFYFSVKNDNFSVFTWQPFWFIETMMSYTDRIGWQRFYSAMTTYKMGEIWHKEILFYGIGTLIFIIGNFWTRLVFLKDLFKKIDGIKVFLLTIIVCGIVAPLFFVQNGTPWNTIQFLYYSLFFAGILAGITVSKFSPLIITAVILLTVPTTIVTLKDIYLPSRPPAMVSVYEAEALEFLKSQEKGIVLTYPFDVHRAKEAISNPPRPLYLYESTAYVSAFSQKQVFLEDEVNLSITGFDWHERREKVLSWYKESDQAKARLFFIDNNIEYIYWIKPQRAYLGETQLGLRMIFENEEVVIFSTK